MVLSPVLSVRVSTAIPRYLAGQDAAAALNGFSTGPPKPDCGVELMKIGWHRSLRSPHLRASGLHRRAFEADARLIAIADFILSRRAHGRSACGVLAK
jgi:hypothetical protein